MRTIPVAMVTLFLHYGHPIGSIYIYIFCLCDSSSTSLKNQKHRNDLSDIIVKPLKLKLKHCIYLFTLTKYVDDSSIYTAIYFKVQNVQNHRC